MDSEKSMQYTRTVRDMIPLVIKCAENRWRTIELARRHCGQHRDP